MDDKSVNQIEKLREIEKLKEEIVKQKESISDIRQLLNEEIDRDFPTDLWELSERELDNEMGNRLSFLNDDIDTRPDAATIHSHRKFIGKPVVLLKRFVMKLMGFYTNTVMEKQRRFNEQLVAFHLASFIRFRQNEAKIKSIEEKLKVLEEDRDLLLEQLDILKNDNKKPGSKQD
jgi:predicted RND superfamily exporter protein